MKKGVVIGVDPHKMSVTIEVVDHPRAAVGVGRFGTDRGRLRRVDALCEAVARPGLGCRGSQRRRPSAGPAAGRGRRTGS